MSHFNAALRKDFAVIHHTSGSNHGSIEDCRFCSSGYDFTVFRNGTFCICVDSASGTPRWKLRPPENTAWHASGCDCRAIGIAFHGRFQNESLATWPTLPSELQKCTAAYIMNHVGIPSTVQRVRPHAECASWDTSEPCKHPCPVSTVCPGTMVTKSIGDHRRVCNGRWETIPKRRWNGRVVAPGDVTLPENIHRNRQSWSAECGWRY